MDVTVIGCSGSFPGPGGPASCYLVQAQGFTMVIDMGNGSLGNLQRYVSLDDIDAVCLSHHHADHCLDMCCFSVTRIHHPDGLHRRKIPVYGPARTAERLQRAESLDPQASGMADSFDFVTLTPGRSEIGPLRVTVDHMLHPVETFGFRVEHEGKAIAYSADTGPNENLVSLAAGADVLLCEASFLDGPGLPADLHMTARQAAEHAARAGVGRLVLTHLVEWNDKALTAEQAAPGFPGPVELASPGLRL